MSTWDMACCTYKYLKYILISTQVHTSTSTPAEIKKYLSKVQVLWNVYLKVLNTSTHVLGPMSGS